MEFYKRNKTVQNSPASTLDHTTSVVTNTTTLKKKKIELTQFSFQPTPKQQLQSLLYKLKQQHLAIQ
jgi:hypothetical protein